jgi:SH3-like domain-containing protein
MMRYLLVAGLLALMLSPVAGPIWAQDASVEEQAEGGSKSMSKAPDPAEAANPDAKSETPRDPSKGAVTGLPIPRFVSLKGNEGNARRGPGLTHRIDWVFTREGMPLKITAEYEHWRRVEDADGAGGWVHYMLLSGVRSVLITQDMAEAHSAPDDTSDVLFQNELNVVGKLVQCVPDWCRIMVEGEKGWVHTSALWGVAPGEILP